VDDSEHPNGKSLVAEAPAEPEETSAAPDAARGNEAERAPISDIEIVSTLPMTCARS
jgi:hypothetical protein